VRMNLRVHAWRASRHSALLKHEQNHIHPPHRDEWSESSDTPWLSVLPRVVGMRPMPSPRGSAATTARTDARPAGVRTGRKDSELSVIVWCRETLGRSTMSAMAELGSNCAPGGGGEGRLGRSGERLGITGAR